MRTHSSVTYVPCVRARLNNMSWADGDKKGRSARLFRLRLFDFSYADSAVAARIGVADCIPLAPVDDALRPVNSFHGAFKSAPVHALALCNVISDPAIGTELLA